MDIVLQRDLRRMYCAGSRARCFFVLISCIGFLAICRPAIAESDIFSFSGFGTIGLTKGGNEQLSYRDSFDQQGESDSWQFKTGSLLGLQLDAHFNDKLHAAVQVIAKDREQQSLDQSISWAFLQYSLNDQLSLRVGRMALDLYNLSEYRDLGFSYLWVRPPTEFYMPIPVHNFDGFDLRYQGRYGHGIVDAKFFVGSSKVRVVSNVTNFDFEIRPVVGLNMSYTKGFWKSRFTLSTSETKALDNPLNDIANVIRTIPVELWPEEEQQETLKLLEADGKRISYFSIGTVYDPGSWLVQGELVRVYSKYDAAPSNISYYVSAGKRVTNSVSLHAGFSRVKSTDSFHHVPVSQEVASGPLAPLIDITGFALNSSRLNQQSISLGLRWDLTTRAAMKAQWDHIKVNKHGVGLWSYAGNMTDYEGELDTFTITLDFVF